MESEPDWKKFRALVPVWRERYIADRNARIKAMLEDRVKTETERFWEVHQVMEKEARILETCLDGHSRSKMWFHLMLMRKAGMIKRDDVADFSQELQKLIFDR
jgi:hypothetical protein